MRREGALTECWPATVLDGADAAAELDKCLLLRECWAGRAAGQAGGVAAAAEVEVCLLTTDLSSAGSSSSPAMALPATCMVRTCIKSHAIPIILSAGYVMQE